MLQHVIHPHDVEVGSIGEFRDITMMLDIPYLSRTIWQIALDRSQPMTSNPRSRMVSVHVVTLRDPCQSGSVLRMIMVYERQTTIPTRSQEIGETLREQAQQMFHWWPQVRNGTLPQAQFQVVMRPIRRQVARLLKAGQTCGVPKTEAVCREVTELSDALWTCVRVEGVEPTNNAAEWAIRPGILGRKGSFGTQRAAGSRFVEALLTVVATLRQQHRNVLAYLTDACQAAYAGKPAPSLLPPRSAVHEQLPAVA
jgi:hypothetical protein